MMGRCSDIRRRYYTHIRLALNTIGSFNGEVGDRMWDSWVQVDG